MRIPLDQHSELPLYRQIEAYFRDAILSGSLAPETRLPASRQLAKDLGVSRITVDNAYAELKAEGLITTRAGGGTYVLPPCPLPPLTEAGQEPLWPLWQQELVKVGAAVPTPDALLARTQHPASISFAGGSGDANLFPVEDFRRAIQTVAHRDGLTALDYGDPCGYLPLRTTIARILTGQGLQTRPENILITSGSQQALGLVCQLLLKPGDVILVESPTYGGGLELFRTLGFRPVGIPVDEHGMQVEQLEELLQVHHPKLIYTIPNFQNPSGTCLDSIRRRHLVALADRYNIPVLEDDFVGDLRYDGRAQPTLKSLDPGGRIIYTSTFSKMLLPGVRVGFIVTDGPVYSALVQRKRVHDLATSNLLQRALDAYVTVGRYETHLRRSVQIYRKRRDAMVQAVQHYLPPDVSYHPPQGGLFLWLTLPDGISAEELLPLARTNGVAFVPGSAFFPNPAHGGHSLRLNFAVHQPEIITEGIQRLGTALKQY